MASPDGIPYQETDVPLPWLPQPLPTLVDDRELSPLEQKPTC